MQRRSAMTLTCTVGGALATVVMASSFIAASASAAPGDTIGPINPVTQPLEGHPANSGFLAFVENDVQLNADEAEGTLALGGDLAFNRTYNLEAARPTFTVPGETQSVTLFVGGGIQFPAESGLILRLLGGAGYAKVADASTYSAFDTDSNGALQNFHIVPPGGTFETEPRIEGTITQTPASIAAPVPDDLIDIPAAFELYRGTSTLLGSCTPTIELVARDDGADLPTPYPPGTNARLTLVAGQTNVLDITAADLANLAEITYTTPPTADTPLLVNITGDFTGSMPNGAGISSLSAPFILWNFVDATTMTVTGGDSLEGTIYAPRALVNWQVTQNIEGNVIAASFIHGIAIAAPVGLPREIHDFPFSTELTCVEAGPTPTPTPTPTTTPTPTPTPTSTPTPTASDGVTPMPSDPAALAASGVDTGWLPVAAVAVLGLGGVLLVGDGMRRRRRRGRA